MKEMDSMKHRSREREKKKEKIEWICITELWQNTTNEFYRKSTQSNFIAPIYNQVKGNQCTKSNVLMFDVCYAIVYIFFRIS